MNKKSGSIADDNPKNLDYFNGERNTLNFERQDGHSLQIAIQKDVSIISINARSQDPILGVPILGPENWKQVFKRSDFKVPFLW